MVDAGQYFTINRARQYGKTTMLYALEEYLKKEYLVISLDFQELGDASFSTEYTFSRAFAIIFADAYEKQCENQDNSGRKLTEEMVFSAESRPQDFDLFQLFRNLTTICDASPKRIVLMIDEVDTATNNQVFLDFLAQLRSRYLKRTKIKTFQSVILAGVTDVKNLKRKLRPQDARKFNSPLPEHAIETSSGRFYCRNIAADFNIRMSFSPADISGMLAEYESDHHTGMDVNALSQVIFDYSGGYPFLVSRICQLLDTDVKENQRFGAGTGAWSKEGVSEAVRRILLEKNTLFESLMGKVHDYPGLRDILQRILFSGEAVPYNPDDISIGDAEIYGFVEQDHGFVKISNRIFETRLYNFFLNTEELQKTEIYRAGSREKEQFIEAGHLNMEHILSRFVTSFDDIYGSKYEIFDEEEGRRRFLLFIRPIINGTGNYYIEAETRNSERMDLVIDYFGQRYVVELKIWRGNAYNERGEKQLSDYLEYYHLKKGYMLSYNFNKNKKIGVHHVYLDDKELVEAVV